ADNMILPFCISIGIVSFCINSITLYLIAKFRKIYTDNIFYVFFILHILYLIQNFHFTILFVPFIYSTLGGGYCIGLTCEPHFVPFHVNFATWIFLVVFLCGFFVLLVFYRQQNLLPNSSFLKLRQRTSMSPIIL
ncbi:hypothetical protein PMAYCL1PPCAC_26546, partial [Pristionchus mayeri]